MYILHTVFSNVVVDGGYVCDCSDTMYIGDYCETKPDYCKDFNCFNKCNASSLNPINPCQPCPMGYIEQMVDNNQTCEGNSHTFYSDEIH